MVCWQYRLKQSRWLSHKEVLVNKRKHSLVDDASVSAVVDVRDGVVLTLGTVLLASDVCSTEVGSVSVITVLAAVSVVSSVGEVDSVIITVLLVVAADVCSMVEDAVEGILVVPGGVLLVIASETDQFVYNHCQ